jgi:hypothetical protein
MSALVQLGQDSTGRSYFACSGAASLEKLPWADSDFDALVFIAPSADPVEVEAVLRALIQLNTDWIYTAGAEAEFWHDRVDQLSVEAGRQQRAGEGSPMTAWFDHIQSLGQWDTSCSFGGSSYFLFVVVGDKLPVSFQISEHATPDA